MAKGVAFRVTCNAGDVCLIGSRKDLAGALVNLLENALQACAEGGKVILGADPRGGAMVYLLAVELVNP